MKVPMPVYEDDVPYCTSKCPLHDGKRCEATGFKPDSMCKPEVERIVKLLASYQRGAE